MKFKEGKSRYFFEYEKDGRKISKEFKNKRDANAFAKKHNEENSPFYVYYTDGYTLIKNKFPTKKVALKYIDLLKKLNKKNGNRYKNIKIEIAN